MTEPWVRPHESPIVSVARCLFDVTRELAASETRYEVADAQRAALEERLNLVLEQRLEEAEELTSIAKLVGLDTDREVLRGVFEKVQEIVAEHDPRVANRGALSISTDRFRRMRRADEEITALIARFEGSAAHEQFCTALRRIVQENLHEVNTGAVHCTPKRSG